MTMSWYKLLIYDLAPRVECTLITVLDLTEVMDLVGIVGGNYAGLSSAIM